MGNARGGRRAAFVVLLVFSRGERYARAIRQVLFDPRVAAQGGRIRHGHRDSGAPLRARAADDAIDLGIPARGAGAGEAGGVGARAPAPPRRDDAGREPRLRRRGAPARHDQGRRRPHPRRRLAARADDAAAPALLGQRSAGGLSARSLGAVGASVRIDAPIPPFRLHPPRSAADIAQAAALFRDYADALDVDLCFQGFDEELAALPGKYAPPAGELLLARGADGAALGCVALRPLDAPDICEMKRLYVRDAARGRGLGQALVAAIIAAAEARGYAEMRLDSLPSMTAALALYRRFGFAEIAASSFNPAPPTPYPPRPLGPRRSR